MNEAIDAIIGNELKDVFDNVDYIRNMDENELKNIQNMIAAIDAFKVLIVEEADNLFKFECLQSPPYGYSSWQYNTQSCKNVSNFSIFFI